MGASEAVHEYLDGGGCRGRDALFISRAFSALADAHTARERARIEILVRLTRFAPAALHSARWCTLWNATHGAATDRCLIVSSGFVRRGAHRRPVARLLASRRRGHPQHADRLPLL